MSKEKERIVQTVKFLKWTKKYPGWWQLLCEAGNEHMNLHMMQLLIKRLAKESFYEIIFVLLEVHKNEKFMKNAKETLMKDLLISKWKCGNKDDMLNKLIAYLE